MAPIARLKLLVLPLKPSHNIEFKITTLLSIHQTARSKITWDKICGLNTPIFFITGGADLYQPPSKMRTAVREISGSETLVIPEAGHAVQ